MKNEGESVRPSPIAGQWYEGRPDRLASVVDTYLQQAKLPNITGEVLAVITPHAGHVYSGHVAGYAFAAIQHLKPDIVVVASPLHQPARGAIFTSGHSAYWTPLGEIQIASEIIAEMDQYLEDHIHTGLSAVINDREHSLEIELPFLQRIYPYPFQLVPLMVREQAPEFLEAVGAGIFQVLQGRKAIVVASTDLSHFYPQPVANKLDERMLAAIENLSPQEMLDLDAREEGFACGLGAVAAVIHYSKLAGANHAITLKHATSGDITGDYSSVVGYGAVAITRKTS